MPAIDEYVAPPEPTTITVARAAWAYRRLDALRHALAAACDTARHVHTRTCELERLAEAAADLAQWAEDALAGRSLPDPPAPYPAPYPRPRASGAAD